MPIIGIATSREAVMTQHSRSADTATLRYIELRQAQLHVDSIRSLNDVNDLEAGHLSGLSLILSHAESVLNATRAAAAGKPSNAAR